MHLSGLALLAAMSWSMVGHLDVRPNGRGCERDPSLVYEEVRAYGLDGIFIKPKDRTPRRSILLLSGSRGGLPLGHTCALAREGYATFGLAYFNRGSLSETLEAIPLEYFERGLSWLEAKTHDTAVVWGVSRGGELALLVASRFPDRVRGVIAVVPSAYVWAGLPKPYKSVAAWRSGNRDVAFVPNRSTGCWGRQRFECSIDRASDAELAEATIPVERIRGPVLLISGSDDQLWPSDTFTRQVRDRLLAFGHPFAVTRLDYANAGHMIGLPHFPLVDQPTFGDMIMGGTAEGYAFANSDAFRAQLGFLADLGDNGSIR